MFLLYLAGDPVIMFDYHDPCPDSVLKFLIDIFSARTTSEFFYTTDMMVLLEIIVRQISDLSPGDRVWLTVYKIMLFCCFEKHTALLLVC